MSKRLLFAVLCATAAPGFVSTAAAQARASDADKWEVPRTPEGHPDLQGNWTNVTLTPFQRAEGRGPFSRRKKLMKSNGRTEIAPLAQGPSRAEGRTTKGMGL